MLKKKKFVKLISRQENRNQSRRHEKRSEHPKHQLTLSYNHERHEIAASHGAHPPHHQHEAQRDRSNVGWKQIDENRRQQRSAHAARQEDQHKTEDGVIIGRPRNQRAGQAAQHKPDSQQVLLAHLVNDESVDEVNEREERAHVERDLVDHLVHVHHLTRLSRRR